MAVVIGPPFRNSCDQFFHLSPGVLLSATVAAAARGKALVADTDLEYAMVDGTIVKDHRSS